MKMKIKMKIDHIDTAKIDLELEMSTNILNVKSVPVQKQPPELLCVSIFPANMHLFQVHNRSTRRRC